MDFKNILNEIEKADPEVYERLSPRRHILKSFGSKVAVAALPFAIGSLFNKAYGKTTGTADAGTVLDVLNFALTLELLEYNFYYQGLTTGVVPTGDNDHITTILNHEKEHVDFLMATIGALGGASAVMPSLHYFGGNQVNPESFDFTANGAFPDIFVNPTQTNAYDVFLAMAQGFEDTGVRAYKGQAPALKSSSPSTDASNTNPYLTAALEIHSVEARHASHIRSVRMVRAALGGGAAKPWITGANSNINGVSSAADATIANIYLMEDTVTQGNPAVNITTLPAVIGNTSTNAATEAFDEPLTKDQVLAVAGLFIKA